MPLVEFHPEIDISDAEAERILLAPPKTNDDQTDPFAEAGNEVCAKQFYFIELSGMDFVLILNTAIFSRTDVFVCFPGK